MSAYDKYFSEPQRFTDGTYVISHEISREQAALEISAEIGEQVYPALLREDRVRFGFAPEFVADRDEFDGPVWYTGAGKGKGTKPVWVYP